MNLFPPFFLVFFQASLLLVTSLHLLKIVMTNSCGEKNASTKSSHSPGKFAFVMFLEVKRPILPFIWVTSSSCLWIFFFGHGILFQLEINLVLNLFP